MHTAQEGQPELYTRLRTCSAHTMSPYHTVPHHTILIAPAAYEPDVGSLLLTRGARQLGHHREESVQPLFYVSGALEHQPLAGDTHELGELGGFGRRADYVCVLACVLLCCFVLRQRK